MARYHIMRTYLVRFRSNIEGESRWDAIRKHREKLETRIGSVEAGSIEILDKTTENIQLGNAANDVRGLQAEKE